MRAESLQWCVTQCRFKPRTAQVLALLWCDGLSRVGAGIWLGVKTSTIQKLEARAKVKMEKVYQKSDQGGKLLWLAMFAEPDESLPLDRDGEIAAILYAMRGPIPSAPPSPEYDVLGREIGRRPPLVSVPEARLACGKSRMQRLQEREEVAERERLRLDQAHRKAEKIERARELLAI